jgi:phage-related protein
LRVVDRDQTWRVLYYLAPDAIVILEVFSKKTAATPKAVLAGARQRLQMFLALSAGKKDANAKR